MMQGLGLYQKVPGELTGEMSYWYSLHSPGMMLAKMLSPRKQAVPSGGAGEQVSEFVPGLP